MRTKLHDANWGNFTKLHHAPMQTALWKELKAHDVFVFTELLGKREQGKFNKPDTYIITPKMLEGRISAPTFYKAISKLIRFGFIEIAEHGGVGIEGLHRANIYILSMKWQEVMERRKSEPSYLFPRPYAPGYRPRHKQ